MDTSAYYNSGNKRTSTERKKGLMQEVEAGEKWLKKEGRRIWLNRRFGLNKGPSVACCLQAWNFITLAKLAWFSSNTLGFKTTKRVKLHKFINHKLLWIVILAKLLESLIPFGTCFVRSLILSLQYTLLPQAQNPSPFVVTSSKDQCAKKTMIDHTTAKLVFGTNGCRSQSFNLRQKKRDFSWLSFASAAPKQIRNCSQSSVFTLPWLVAGAWVRARAGMVVFQAAAISPRFLFCVWLWKSWDCFCHARFLQTSFFSPSLFENTKN